MKKIISIILCLCLALSLCGCTAVGEFIDSVQSALTVEERPHIAFSGGTLFKDSEEEFFEAYQILEFETEAKKYRQDHFYNLLSENEKIVYLAFEYAMCEGFNNVLVDDLLVEDVKDLSRILRFLSYDSPLLEQNLRYATGTFNTSYEAGIIGNAQLDGVYIVVDNFTPELWEKKKEAIKKAEEIVAALPEGLSGAEKAERLYRTASEAEYYDYGDDLSVFPFLYDALITGKTHCDGYANALSLLYNIAGIKCVEKDYTSTVEGEMGHTWTFFELDGKWYNADATGGKSMIPKQNSGMKAGYYFGYSDFAQIYTPDRAELYPAANEGLYMNIDATVSTVGDHEFYTEALKGFRAHKGWSMIEVAASTDADCDRQIGKVATALGVNLVYYVIDVASGNKMVLMCYRSYYK